jgi:hydrogenase maturation factor HypF (carbamoyltransferase family)
MNGTNLDPYNLVPNNDDRPSGSLGSCIFCGYDDLYVRTPDRKVFHVKCECCEACGPLAPTENRAKSLWLLGSVHS